MNAKILSIVSVACSFAACGLDTSNKTRCDTDADCLTGRVCLAHVCHHDAGSSDGGSGSGATLASAGADPRPAGASGANFDGGASAVSGGAAPAADGGMGGNAGEPASAPRGLLGLAPSVGTLQPPFDPSVTEYSLELSLVVSKLSLSAEIGAATSVTLGQQALTSGQQSSPIALSAYDDDLELVVAAADTAPQSYTVRVHHTLGTTSQFFKPLDISGAAILGISMAADGDRLVVGTQVAADVFYKADGTFMFEQHLEAKGASAIEGFGRAVSISGDRIAIGAPGEDSSATGVDGDQSNHGAEDSGAVYVYVRDRGGWRTEAYIKASNTGYADKFGISVALKGDLLAVGSPFEDSGATGVNGNQHDETQVDSGAVYLFERDSSGWHQVAYVKSPQHAPPIPGGPQFGWSVALDDHELAVGAYLEGLEVPGGAEQAGVGAAYVVRESNGIWQHEARLQAQYPDGNDYFGQAVAIEGDLVAIGAPYEASAAKGINGDETDNSSGSSGAVYLYQRGPQGFTQAAYIKPNDSQAGDAFGYSLALSGKRLAVGAERNGEADGCAYLFGVIDDKWSQLSRYDARSARDNPPQDTFADNFGFVVALSAQGLFVSAPFEQPFANEAGLGAIYIFE